VSVVGRRLIVQGFAAVALLSLSAAAEAREGSVEIGAACVAAGCMPGDAAGFPISITSPGSYRLVSDLVVTDPNATAVFVAADDVAIDLNGFTIRGPTRCTGAPLVCQTTGSGDGIAIDLAQSPPPARTSVSGGVISGRRNALYLGAGSSVRDVTVDGNSAAGIRVGAGSLVRSCIALANANGIYLDGGGAVATESVASRNTVGFASFASGTSISRCSAVANGLGIQGAGAIIENSVVGNSGDGISGFQMVLGNTATQNGGDGIEAGARSGIYSNTATGNGQVGLLLGEYSLFRGNVVSGNQTSVLSSTGDPLVDLGANACNGTAVCP